MPLAPRHAGPASLTERWLSTQRALPLLLCLGLGWLWPDAPVAAQDQILAPAAEATGSYRNLAENHAGTFHLRREGNAVYATFQTGHSPVQFLARDQPEALLTVPAGFRPAVDVTWEVSARPVRTDGAPRPDPSEHRVFRMRVDTEGQVRYVDDPSMDGVGYLEYRTVLAWPLAGTEPRVCERHQNIRGRHSGGRAGVGRRRGALLAGGLDPSGPHPRPVPAGYLEGEFCATRPAGPDQPRRVAGDVWFVGHLSRRPAGPYPPATDSADRGERPGRPAGGSVPLHPRLAHLALGSDSRQDLVLPVDLLAHTPHLESLHLEGRHSAELARQLLARTPRLTRLTVTPSTPLPETFLEAAPRLTHLTVKGGLEPCATPDLLAPVPHLRHVTVRMTAVDGELTCLGRALQLHTPALAELHLELRGLLRLEAGVLPELPRLTHLTLDMGDQQLPAQLLVDASELTHLALRGGNPGLPADFLAHTPRLTSLSLQADRLSHISPDLLEPVPDLRQVRVDTGDATSLPTRFLDRVTELRMDTGRSDLPWDFLMYAPHLEGLHLTAHSLDFFPEGFLAHAPRLETFHLDAGRKEHSSDLRSFPEGFLTHAPSLVELRLRVPALQAFPPSFLGHVPRLETLELENSNPHPSPYPEKLHVTFLPANFLIHAPRLRHLDLEPLGHVKAFPQGFLSGSPQLRYLDLDANEAKTLPTDFLSRHPRLETIRLRANHMPALPQGFLSRSPNLMDLKLDLQRVEVLPEDFLAETPRLWNLEIDVHGVESLPSGFLANMPQLTRLNLRALNLTALPADFLAHAPRIRTLGLAMPLLEPTLTPDHRLWETLQAASLRVKVIRPDPYLVADPDGWWEHCSFTTSSRLGAILEVEGRAPDNSHRTLLRVSGWEERELFAFKYWPCPYLIDSRFTAPTLAVCAAYRDPNECIPMGERSEAPDPEWGSDPAWGRG